MSQLDITAVQRLGDGGPGQQQMPASGCSNAVPQPLLQAAEDVRGVLEPTGFRLLICIPPRPEKNRQSLYEPEGTRRALENASLIGQVVAMGPAAYKDKERFPDGPWCEVGDFIVMRAYSGTGFKRAGCPFEYRLINDDTVEAVLKGSDPTEIERPF